MVFLEFGYGQIFNRLFFRTYGVFGTGLCLADPGRQGVLSRTLAAALTT